ncbi:MAG: AAA family ATPase [Candidatus Kapabacteria bacterium]|jgi:predicted ATPase|nr:AAA family ATPase [Candidatus Kapabacteria bacterium]
MQIESIQIQNYKVFRSVEVRNLPMMCVFLGANGVGKSTFFEVFGFLSDALKTNVRAALGARGGWKEVVSREQNGDIVIIIKFRNTPKDPIITYELAVGLPENSSLPVVKREILSYRRGRSGRPFRFLDFANGIGLATVNEEEFAASKQDFQEKREEFRLDSPDILAIKGLGQFQRFKAISDFRKLLDNWYVANFQIPDAKRTQDQGFSERLSPTGDNLAQVADFMYEHHPELFQRVLEKMQRRVPGIESVQAYRSEEARILLRFHDGSFKDPFLARYVSDGTLKMFAYLLLLNTPFPYQLLCIEEPENYLHPDLLMELAEEFREYAALGRQVFISTHSPDFVNALTLNEVFWLTKNNGQTTIQRASDDEVTTRLVSAGDSLGALWMQGYLRGSGVAR